MTTRNSLDKTLNAIEVKPIWCLTRSTKNVNTFPVYSDRPRLCLSHSHSLTHSSLSRFLWSVIKCVRLATIKMLNSKNIIKFEKQNILDKKKLKNFRVQKASRDREKKENGPLVPGIKATPELDRPNKKVNKARSLKKESATCWDFVRVLCAP